MLLFQDQELILLSTGKVTSISMLLMALIVTNMLNEFIVNNYAYDGVEILIEQDSLIIYQKYSFQAMKDSTSNHKIEWNNFHELLQQMFKENRVRNCINTRSLNFSFELSISLSKGEEGLYLHMNPRFKLFGFLFCSYKQKTEIPISIDKGIVRDDLSYFPFNLKQASTATQLTLLINQHYPNLMKIEPMIAMTPVKRSEYINENGADSLSDVDLYQTLLSQSHANMF